MAGESLPAWCPDSPPVRDLLRLCARTRDRAERAAILTRVAHELDMAAGEVALDDRARVGARELVAGLRGQASMARLVADLERRERARGAAGA